MNLLHTRLTRLKALGQAGCSRSLVILACCLLAGLAAYAPALGGGLIWDDVYLIGENPFFRSPIFGWEVFRHYLFFDSFSTYYRPVQNWSYMLDYWLWRDNTAGYHLTNILLHAGTGFLLYRLLRRLLPDLLREGSTSAGRSPVIAAAVALLWVVHPVHNAAVAYISGRADSLAAFFALCTWSLALRADRTRGARRAVLGLVAGLVMLVALSSKEIALMWLVLFLAHAWWKGRKGARWAMTMGALAVLALYAALHSLPAYRAPMEDGPAAPLEVRALLMLRALGDYSGLMLFPARLYMERSLSDAAALRSATEWRLHVGGEWLSVIGLLALGCAIAFCRWEARGRELRIAGAAWFGVAFLPISNLYPLNAEVAEHWIYLASVGFILLVAGAVWGMPRRVHGWAGALAGVAVFALGARTALRSADWVDAETFCLRTIESGGATPRILSTLAGIYGRRGDWHRQEAVLRQTLERFPEFTPARIHLGICLAKQGRAPEAEGLLDLGSRAGDETARRFPRTWPAALSLARLRHERGDDAAARAMLREARVRFPEIWEIVRYESELACDLEGAQAALALVEPFAAERWWHLDSRLTLGRLRAAAGDAAGAISSFEEASHLDLYDGRPFAAVAEVELARQHPDAALAAQCAAIARDPERSIHYLELGAILGQLGRKSEADAALHKAQLLAARADKS